MLLLVSTNTLELWFAFHLNKNRLVYQQTPHSKKQQHPPRTFGCWTKTNSWNFQEFIEINGKEQPLKWKLTSVKNNLYLKFLFDLYFELLWKPVPVFGVDQTILEHSAAFVIPKSQQHLFRLREKANEVKDCVTGGGWAEKNEEAAKQTATVNLQSPPAWLPALKQILGR